MLGHFSQNFELSDVMTICVAHGLPSDGVVIILNNLLGRN